MKKVSKRLSALFDDFFASLAQKVLSLVIFMACVLVILHKKPQFSISRR